MAVMEEIEKLEITPDTYVDLARILDMMPPSMIRKDK